MEEVRFLEEGQSMKAEKKLDLGFNEGLIFLEYIDNLGDWREREDGHGKLGPPWRKFSASQAVVTPSYGEPLQFLNGTLL